MVELVCAKECCIEPRYKQQKSENLVEERKVIAAEYERHTAKLIKKCKKSAEKIWSRRK